MKVLVTGASGFLGSHMAEALVRDGHEVRAAARSLARIRHALQLRGCFEEVEPVEADTTIEEDVERAVAGCDAVVHAAASYTLDPRRAANVLAQNVRGTELVLGKAVQRGLDPIIHISSYAALLPGAPEITADSPVGRPPTAYALSKARSEDIARAHQAAGAPVTIIQPGMVWGPGDPASGESTLFARWILGGQMPMGIPGRVPVVDVRDVAAAVAACLVPARGPRRYLATGELVSMRDIQGIVAQAAGRRPPRGSMPAKPLLAMARLADRVQSILPVRLPVNYQGVWTALNCPRCDASKAERELGVVFRPAAESILETAHAVLAARAAEAGSPRRKRRSSS
ncbi:SDR family NAD(P)-dependent oxidoreductase [Paeniglutamicibacter psychrophenolicus]|uniref:Nucleoside-diphosphate-sugar epimerase n=1 Tax=Paeniglutamicibacter psychrophenolicus TaxID=257454 RepID=A0ABS4WG02_9MICC|nr:SDR family NAD(P)-dependent oxidoreductase [Paeniglutamicibacter psychrophenolicus]MBP2375122.1 nucleoside-diphosphate-sugar epimerase [Paeniglutamicibacter psychrophenolicus]